MKAAVSTILLLFVAASLVYLVVGGRVSTVETADAPDGSAGDVVAHSEPGSAPAGEMEATEDTRPQLVAYYFHGDFRCRTCLAMERYAREAIEQTFAEELKRGDIEWRAVNYDLPENEHYRKTYGLTASAVVVAATVKDSPVYYRNLARVWDLVGDEFGYKAYVINEVEEMMEAGL